MKRRDCFPARLEALKAAERAHHARRAALDQDGVHILMKGGKWLVPPEQRPKLAPPPVETGYVHQKILKSICSFNGLR